MEENTSGSTGQDKILKPLLKLALPIILAQLFQVAYSFTDTYWVGKLGGNAVASITMSMPILYLLTSLGIGFAIAGSTLTAQYFGAKDEKNLSRSAAQTMLMVVAVSLVVSIIGFIFSADILHLLGADPAIFADALSYLRIEFVALIFNFAFFIFQSIMRSVGRPQTPVYIVVGTVILNFVLDPLFMFGWGPINGSGVAGVAIATALTQSIAAIAGLSLLFGGKHGIHLHWHDFRPDFAFIKKAFFLGLPASIEQSARSLSLTVITGLIAAFGTVAVAAYGLGTNILQLMLMASFGLAGATAAMVGHSLGAGDPKRAKRVALLGMKLSAAAFTTIGVIAFIFAPSLIRFFVPHEIEVITAGTRYLHYIAPIFALIAIQIIAGSSLQASGHTAKAMKLTLFSQWVVQIPLIYAFSRFTNLGIDGIWLAFPVTSVIMSAIYLYIFFKSGWENKKLISQEDKLSVEVQQESETETGVPYET
ncbi:MAG: MATE family efflux transporter [Bacillota bacterium]